jgi:hypothetical protein
MLNKKVNNHFLKNDVIVDVVFFVDCRATLFPTGSEWDLCFCFLLEIAAAVSLLKLLLAVASLISVVIDFLFLSRELSE